MRTYAEAKTQTPSHAHATPVPNALAHKAHLRNVLRRAGVQPRLEVGAADALLEREADAAAERVLHMSEPQTAAPNFLRAKASAASGTPASPHLESSLSSLNSGGSPLDAQSRAFFEPRFGEDFSQVRLHTGDAAAQMASALNARAFTLGNNIAFASGQYSAATTAGQSLLGHELAHVIQQRSMPSLQAKRVQRQSELEEENVCREEPVNMCPSLPEISRDEIIAEVNEWVGETGFFAIIPTLETPAQTSSQTSSTASASGYSDWAGGLGGGAVGTLGQLGGFPALGWKLPGFGLHAKGTQVFIRGTPFIFSLKPPQGSHIPSGGSTSHAFLTEPLRPNRGLRVDYHPLNSAGKSVWHWNHQSVASTFNVTQHSTAGAAGPGRLAVGLKAGGRILVPVGIVVSGVEIANSPTPVYEAGRQASGWAGAAAVGAVGAKGGAAIGAAVGVWFGGVGAIPGAAIGGFLGGLGSGIVGWFGGTKTYEAIIPVPAYHHD